MRASFMDCRSGTVRQSQARRRIASAGCFATALQLALLPLRGLDVGFIAATAVTGSSGSGTMAMRGHTSSDARE